MVYTDIRLGDIVRMRKPHPCGSLQWEVVRLGADIGIRCQGCGRRVLLPRSQFDAASEDPGQPGAAGRIVRYLNDTNDRSGLRSRARQSQLPRAVDRPIAGADVPERDQFHPDGTGRAVDRLGHASRPHHPGLHAARRHFQPDSRRCRRSFLQEVDPGGVERASGRVRPELHPRPQHAERHGGAAGHLRHHFPHGDRGPVLRAG